MRFLGLDLTDPFARHPRPVDVAEVDARGRVRFSEVRWPLPSSDGGLSGEALRAAFRMSAGEVWVVDGPHALARPGARVRDAERLLRTPGRTPEVLPQPGPPFHGFMRGSVLLFAALRASGPEAPPLLDVDTPEVGRARLLEAFPGATWRALAVDKLGAKASREGRARRQALLEAEGLRFAPGELPTHDALDAALCAWLGWLTRVAPERVHAVGTATWVDAEGGLREGRILDLNAAARAP